MAEKKVSIRLVAEGGQQLRAEFTGIGAIGEQAMQRVEDALDSAGIKMSVTKAQVEAQRRAYAELRAGVDPAFAALSRYETVQEQVNRAVASGITSQQEGARVLSLLAARLFDVSDAADQAAASVARVDTSVQTRISGMVGMDRPIRSAADSASVFAGRQEADDLRASLDPLYAASMRYASALDQIQDQQIKGNITQAEVIRLQGLAAQRHLTTASAVDRERQSFAELRAGIDPAYAAARRFEMIQLQVNRAVAAGAVTQAEATRVLDLYRAQATTAAAGAGRVGLGFQNAGYQVQDFAIQVAGGQNALVAFGQQAPQLLMGLGLPGHIGLITAAVSTLLAVGVAVAPMLMDWGDAGKSVDDAIGDLNATIDRHSDYLRIANTDVSELRAEYGRWAEEVKAFAGFMAEVSLDQALTDMDAAIDPITAGLARVVSSLAAVRDAQAALDRMEGHRAAGLATLEQVATSRDALDTLQAQADEAAASLKLNTDQAVALNDAIRAVGDAGTMAEVADAAGLVLSQIEAWFPAGQGMSAEMQVLVTHLDGIRDRAAKVATEAEGTAATMERVSTAAFAAIPATGALRAEYGELAGTVRDVLQAQNDLAAADFRAGIADLADASTAAEDLAARLGQSADWTADLQSGLVGIAALDTFGAQASALGDMAAHIADASDGLENMTPEARALYEEVLAAARQAADLAAVSGQISFAAAASSAAQLAAQLGVSFRTAQALMQMGGGRTEEVIYDPRDPRYDPVAAEMGRIREEYGTVSPFDPSRNRAETPTGGSAGGSGGQSEADRDQQERLREAQRIINATRTDLERLNDEMARLQELNAAGLFAEAPQAFDREMSRLQEEMREAQIEASGFKDITDDLKSSILDLAMGGTDAFDQLKDSIKRAAFEYALFGSGPLEGLFNRGQSSGGSVWGGILGGLLSFDGGGYTWDGPRSGGIDGRGGRLAVLHPGETVIDHTKPGRPDRDAVMRALSDPRANSIQQLLTRALLLTNDDRRLPSLAPRDTLIGGETWEQILDKMASFDGGGSTGDGPRFGGLDGRGGKLAILHPQEKVIDQTKPTRGAEQPVVRLEVVPNPYFDAHVDQRATARSVEVTGQGMAAQSKTVRGRVMSDDERYG